MRPATEVTLFRVVIDPELGLKGRFDLGSSSLDGYTSLYEGRFLNSQSV